MPIAITIDTVGDIQFPPNHDIAVCRVRNANGMYFIPNSVPNSTTKEIVNSRCAIGMRFFCTAAAMANAIKYENNTVARTHTNEHASSIAQNNRLAIRRIALLAFAAIFRGVSQ